MKVQLRLVIQLQQQQQLSIAAAAAASTSASTTQSTATKQILNSLILDFLQKQQLVETAKVFTREIPNLSNVPPTMDCPQGFLFEWWLIFSIYSKLNTVILQI